MSLENMNSIGLSLCEGIEKNSGNITHLGQNITKLQKSKQVLEKNLGSLTLQMDEVKIFIQLLIFCKRAINK